MAAIWYDALFEVRLGNPQRVAALADEMKVLVDKFAFAHGRYGSRWFRGWADTRMGQPREGYRSIREAYDQNAQLGMLAGRSETLGYAAEALLLARRLGRSARPARGGIAVRARARGARVPAAAVPGAGCDCPCARRQCAAAHASARQALAEAKAQKAAWLELIALIELCASDGAQAEDRQALATLIEQLPEAGDTAALSRARALLRATKTARRPDGR